MNYLGISLGTKNMKTLRREDIEEAFITSFVDSVYVYVMSHCGSHGHDIKLSPRIKYAL